MLEKTLESPLNCKEVKQSILKEICPEYLLEGLMLKLKLQYFGCLIQRTDSFEKTLMLERLKVGRKGDGRGAWWAAVHGVTMSQARLSNFTFTFHFPALQKEMATRSSVLAWRIPATGKPGGLPSTGSQRVRHD